MGGCKDTYCSLSCLEGELTRQAIEVALKDGTLLWLDLADAGRRHDRAATRGLQHPPAGCRGSQEFGQRPKIEDYGSFVYLVAYGARGLDQPLAEVHCFYAEQFLVTVHREEIGGHRRCLPDADPAAHRPPAGGALSGA